MDEKWTQFNIIKLFCTSRWFQIYNYIFSNLHIILSYSTCQFGDSVGWTALKTNSHVLKRKKKVLQGYWGVKNVGYTFCRTKTDRKKIRVINTFKENLAILVNLQAKLIRTGRLTLTHFNLFHFRFLFSMKITIILFWNIFIWISWPHLVKQVFTMTGEWIFKFFFFLSRMWSEFPKLFFGAWNTNGVVWTSISVRSFVR